MDLITTHKNADFDALSSLVAAKKLYPKARLLLPGSQEKAVRRFLSLIKDKIKIEEEKTCKVDDVKRLIIVDNRHKSRIGIAAQTLNNKDIKIHIYDHHPRAVSDIKGDKDVFEEVGATVTLLLELLDKKGKLDLSPLEATLMLLGIYEETGFLSYRTTTKKDVDMVGKLLGMGANLAATSSYLNRELTEGELKVLVDLLGATEVVNISGVDIAFSKVDSSGFDGEMGTVVHKLMEVENYPVLFAFFHSGARTRILARSKVETIDVNRIMKHFSGGGHSSASSAKVTGKSYEAVKGEILEMLSEVIHPRIYAKDIMSSPVKTVSQEEKVKNVRRKLEGWGFKGAPCVDLKGDLVGMITLGDLKKAFKSDMAHSRVKGYMNMQLRKVEPDTPLYVLKKIIQDEGKGRIPIVEDNKLIGIVTRTDVLREIHSSFFMDEKVPAWPGVNISKKIKAALPKKLMQTIIRIGAEADHAGMNAFLVGGFVRDVILGRKNYDLDIVVEGNAIKFGECLAKSLGGTLVVHKKFGTATLVQDWPKWLGPSLHPDNKFKIDIATARRETYAKPAALPNVEFSSLREDLYRRDFTINAMAVNINKRNFGFFIDFFGGIEGLKNKSVRVLHDKSFIDDPTRIFRAVRFEQRLNFKIERHTEYLVQHAVKQEMFSKTENQRIRDELILMLKEEHPEKAVFRMRELHELRFIHQDIILPRSPEKIYADIRKAVKWYRATNLKERRLDVWLMNFMIMLDKLSKAQVEEVLGSFVFRRGETTRIRSYKESGPRVIKELSSRKKMLPSRVYTLLEPLSHEVTLCLLAKSKSGTAQKRIKKFFTEYNGMTLKIKGSDVQAEGIKPGPKYKTILKRVLCEKLDGRLLTKQDEVRYLRKILRKKVHGR